MQALVKTPHTDIRIHGDIPPRILDALKSEYGAGLKIYEGDEECVDVKETDWYSGLNVSPGDVLRVYRENAGLTQTRIGEMLGNIPRQRISNMENGSRGISVDMAKKLATILHAPPSTFLGLK